MKMRAQQLFGRREIARQQKKNNFLFFSLYFSEAIRNEGDNCTIFFSFYILSFEQRVRRSSQSESDVVLFYARDV